MTHEEISNRLAKSVWRNVCLGSHHVNSNTPVPMVHMTNVTENFDARLTKITEEIQTCTDLFMHINRVKYVYTHKFLQSMSVRAEQRQQQQ